MLRTAVPFQVAWVIHSPIVRTRLIAVIQQRKANDIIRPHLPVVCRRGIVGYSPNDGPSAPTLDADSFAVLIVNQLKDSVLSFEEK